MANSRKTIIMNEILFWKQNKLLPDQYCDFLMTLYSEGNEVELEEEISHKKSVKAKEKRNRVVLTMIVSILSIALVMALFMVSTALTLLVAIVAGIVAIVLMIGAFRMANKSEFIAPILQSASALLLFALSVKLSTQYFPDYQLLLYGLLMMNCLIWLFAGFKLKLMYFSVSGAIGLVALIGYQVISLF